MADERETAVAVFDDRTHAENAVAELCRSGFRPEQVGLVVRDGSAEVERPDLDAGTRAPKGAEAGAVTGGALGALLGATLATVVLPGIGPVIAGGLLAGLLGGVVTGAASGGIVGALLGLKVPKKDAHRYAHEFHSGRTLVTVQAGGRFDEAVAILYRHGGHDGNLPPAPPGTEEEESPVHPGQMRSRMSDLAGDDHMSQRGGTVFPGGE
jgi:hypothetical protein